MWAANALGLGLGCKINGMRLDFRVPLSTGIRVLGRSTLTSQNLVGSVRIPG